MAPKTAKAKKVIEDNIETGVAKKGRKKVKLDENSETVVNNLKVDVTKGKSNKSKKVMNEANIEEKDNGGGDVGIPAKRNKKKKIEETATQNQSESNGSNSLDEDELPKENDPSEINANNEEEKSAPPTKGRKKQTKKPLETNEETNEKENSVKKPKLGKGRPRIAKAAVDESEEKTETIDEEAKTEFLGTKKAKKKPATKVKEQISVTNEDIVKEPKKKCPKSAKIKKVGSEEIENEKAKSEPASKRRKVVKKDKNDEDDAENDIIEKPSEHKPVKGKKGQKKEVADSNENDEDTKDKGENNRRRKEEKAPTQATKKKTLSNKSSTNYDDIDFSNASGDWNFKIASWNVDGIRAWMNKGGLDYIEHEKPDILCLQEVKCAKEKLPDDIVNLPGYHAYWLCSDKDGYAGVGVYTKKLAMNIQYGLENEDLDSEGRIITAEYEYFYLICTYVPNAGRKLVTLDKRLQWNNEFRKYVKRLDEQKPVIICGDMNVAHNEIDLANPKTNRKNAGFTDEERSGMTDLLGDGFIDTYRHFYPEQTGAYTFWTYMMNSRAKNVGWRLDYFIVSERLVSSLCDSVIRHEVFGSDHCPIALFLNLGKNTKDK